MAAFLFKIKFGDSLRRLNVPQRFNSSGPDITFSGLETRIREMFQIDSASDLRITYIDRDNDLVTMGGDQDVEDACVIQGLNTVRLEIKIVDGKQKTAPSETGIDLSLRETAETKLIPEWESFLRNALLNLKPDVLKQQLKAYETCLRATGPCATIAQTLEGLKAYETCLETCLRATGPCATIAQTLEGLKAYETCLRATGPCATIAQTLEGLLKALAGSSSAIQTSRASGATLTSDGATDAAAVPSFSSSADHKLASDFETCSRKGASEHEIFGRIFHKGVQCDGCGMTPIVGPRYKSIKKDDYDLCYSCYLDIGNEADFQRIDRPVRRNCSRIGIVSGDDRPISGVRSMGPSSPDGPMGPPPPPGPIAHLPPVAGPMGPPPFRPYFPKCRYGWKNELYARNGPGVTGNAFGEHIGGKLDARFVRDVTIFDGTELAPGTNFTKIWRLRNIGSVPWPRETQLVFVGGDVLGSDSPVGLELPEQGLPPEEEIEASVDLVAPQLPGRYVSHWRLMVPWGQKFGHRVWVLIQVVPKEEQSPQVVESLRPLQQVSEQDKLEINLAEKESVMDSLKVDISTLSSSEVDVAVDKVAKLPVDEQQLEQRQSSRNPLGTVDSEVGGFSMVEKPVECDPPSPSQSIDLPITDYVNVLGTLDQNQVIDCAQQTQESKLPEMSPADISDSLLTEEQQDGELDTPTVREDVQAILEETLLEQLESMGFNQRNVNYELLKKNKNNLQSTVEDLVAATEWDPILTELEEMGFVDKEMNLSLMFKHNGSVKRVVTELVQMQIPAGKASGVAAVKNKEKAL